MSKLVVKGGIALKGEVIPVANKNSILSLIPAAILTDSIVTFYNVPKSSSVRVMLEIYESLGGVVEYVGNSEIKLDSSKMNSFVIDDALSKKERASYMFLGPLLTRFGKAEIADGGGCKLGNRPVDTIFQGLISLGVGVEMGDKFVFSTERMKGNDNICLIEASVTGTENLILAAVKTKGKTVIYNAACEPHVQDLCKCLNLMGADITGIGTNKIEIKGVEELGGVEWTISSDHIDIGGLIVAAVVTNGEITIKNAIPEHMVQILSYFKKLNLKYEVRDQNLFIPANQQLEAKRNIKGDIDKIIDMPWPNFPVDLIPEALILALCAKGSMRIYSNMYETQLFFVEEMKKFGAQTAMGNQNQVVTFGPTKFVPSNINSPEIIQCAYALFLCALAAKGESVINNADTIFRRYPEIIEQFKKLGADIERVN